MNGFTSLHVGWTNELRSDQCLLGVLPPISGEPEMTMTILSSLTGVEFQPFSDHCKVDLVRVCKKR